MAAPFVALLAAAAEAYAKELAATVGAGIVETLFHQGAIARDLGEIKRQLAALSDFIRNRLPGLVQHAVDLSLARKTEFDVVEKARTIQAGIAVLEQARKDKLPDWRIAFLVSELVGNSNAILEMGGTLVSYGQPHYACVGISLGAGLQGYAAAISAEPGRAKGLEVHASQWIARLPAWVDTRDPSSFKSKLNWLRERHALGSRCVPSFETWNTHTTREVAISWRAYENYPVEGKTGVFVQGAWFGYVKDKGLFGNHLGWWLLPGTTFDQALAQGTLKPTIPEWWTVLANVPASGVAYQQCADSLASLIADYYAYEELAPPVANAVKLVEDALATLRAILESLASKAEDRPPVDFPATSTHDVERIEAALRTSLPAFLPIAHLRSGTIRP